MAPRQQATQRSLSLQPYLHQEDILLFGCGDQVFHLFGVHSKRFLAQHILPSLEEQQADFPVLCVQHSQVHNVCQDTDALGSATDNHNNMSFPLPMQPSCSKLTNVWVLGQLLIAAISCRNTMLLGKLFGTHQAPRCDGCYLFAGEESKHAFVTKSCSHSSSAQFEGDILCGSEDVLSWFGQSTW